MTRLERIQLAHKEMDQLQSNLSKYGAGDTEPDWHYQNAVRNAVLGREFESLNAHGWEIFDGVAGSGKAAQRLNAQTRKITKLILGARVSELHEIREWVRNNLWRVDL
jgi:hypothetical protein